MEQLRLRPYSLVNVRSWVSSARRARAIHVVAQFVPRTVEGDALSPYRRGHHRVEARVVSDPPIDAPDMEFAQRAHDLVHDCCPAHVVAHSERSFQFAALVARAEAVEVDMEVLYIGTILHDVGLARRFDGPERFEMRGANVVRTMLLDAGMQAARAEKVWDVIALHARSQASSRRTSSPCCMDQRISRSPESN